MNRAFIVCLCLGLLGGVALAQQPNNTNATQMINGQNGPPFPITGVAVPLGVPSLGLLQGLPNANFVTFVSHTLAPGGWTVLGNQLFDLDAATTSILFDGLAFPSIYKLDGTGQFQAQFQADSPGVTVGFHRALQTGLVDPTAPAGASLTAATEFQIVPGITTFPGPTGDDSSVTVTLTPFGFSLPFYNNSYSQFYVASNGFVSFNTTTTDFTSTPTEMLSQMPRIAMFWCDLSPNQGGNISIQVDESTPIQVVRVIFNNVAEFGAGPSHTFDMDIDILGNININSSAFNPPTPTFAMLTGISPGANQSAVTTAVDIYPTLSGAPISTANNDAVFEWFGTSAAQYWTGGASNPYDLTGRTFSAIAIAPGQYFCTSF
ncbi:MAG: hypothetical protein HRU14_02270 [Planctomycetes bacterium]|nr:hypothetical protein [Planctomycetota bacterium]